MYCRLPMCCTRIHSTRTSLICMCINKICNHSLRFCQHAHSLMILIHLHKQHTSRTSQRLIRTRIAWLLIAMYCDSAQNQLRRTPEKCCRIFSTLERWDKLSQLLQVRIKTRALNVNLRVSYILYAYILSVNLGVLGLGTVVGWTSAGLSSLAADIPGIGVTENSWIGSIVHVCHF